MAIKLIGCVYFQNLERKLSNVLRQSFLQCPTIEAKLRLLEVFEGISGRELVQVWINTFVLLDGDVV